MPNKQLTVMVVGQYHNEFTLPPVLLKLLKTIVRNQIPCAFLQEGPSTETLADTLRHTQSAISVSFPGLNELITQLSVTDPDTLCRYLPKSAQGRIRTFLAERPLFKIDGSKGLFEQIIMEVYRIQAYKQEVPLYQYLLEHPEIHFANIDAPGETYRKLIASAANSMKGVFQTENIRIEHMKKNTISVMEQYAQSGGIIFVMTGLRHAHRLAVNLSQAYAQQFEATSISIRPLAYVSPYLEEFDAESEPVRLEAIKRVDAPSVVAGYEQLPCPRATYRKVDGSIPELEDLVNKAIVEHQKSPSSLGTFFSPAPMATAHEKLGELLIEHYADKPEAYKTLMAAYHQKDYALLLRKLCHAGDYVLTNALLHMDLPIDYHQTSSNGKTALAWFEASTATPIQKREISKMLTEKMRMDEREEKTVHPNPANKS